MNKLLIVFTLLFLSVPLVAHEMVPTYPKWERGIYPGILSTTVEIFNKRKDVEYYEIGLFDKDWNPVYFVADYKVIQLKYLSSASIDIYIAKEEKDRVEYVCSRSKIRKSNETRTAISSRICSRFKE
jgi:hypothetical protein